MHDAMACLRPAFADPGICKVFHGADSDVLWLQRDFHIYTVNLFDTARVSCIVVYFHIHMPSSNVTWSV